VDGTPLHLACLHICCISLVLDNTVLPTKLKESPICQQIWFQSSLFVSKLGVCTPSTIVCSFTPGNAMKIMTENGKIFHFQAIGCSYAVKQNVHTCKNLTICRHIIRKLHFSQAFYNFYLMENSTLRFCIKHSSNKLLCSLIWSGAWQGWYYLPNITYLSYKRIDTWSLVLTIYKLSFIYQQKFCCISL